LKDGRGFELRRKTNSDISKTFGDQPLLNYWVPEDKGSDL
jgi:hypothetical protein